MQVILDDSHWQGVDEGTEALVEQWLVTEGARVTAGQPLAQVVIVKASCEVVSPVNGVVTRILVPADGTFLRGAPLAEVQA
jgi:pyruvate/2-oxoglutarate dehydrogenase complex dihydrolipoamide acyltransferase (E2) component